MDAHTHIPNAAGLIIDPTGAGNILTWAELEKRSGLLANALIDIAASSQTGSWAVEVANDNTQSALLLLIGALRTDIPVIMRDKMASEAEQEAVGDELRRAGISIIRSLDDNDLARTPQITKALSETRRGSRKQLPAHSFVLSSGGSTGRPKLVINTALRQSGRGHGGLRVTDRLNWDADQVQLVTGRLHHAAPLTFFVYGLLDGNQLVVPSRFVPSAAARLIDELRINWLEATPFQLQRMAEWLQRNPAHLGSLKGVLHMAAPCPSATKKFWISQIGAERVFEIYGATEGIGMTIANGTEWLARPGTVGRGFCTQLRILDDAMTPQPPGTTGHVFMRTLDRARSAYLTGGKPRVTPDGFMSVGDLGHLDQDGYLFLAPRRIDLLNVGGENVYPAEVEQVLLRHPGIADAGVTGIPDPNLGLRPVAFVTCWPGNVMEERDILAFCRMYLPRFKVPKHVIVIDEIPHNSVGKIDRATLADLAALHPGPGT